MPRSSSEESSDVEAESGAAAAATDASELVAHTALEPALQSLHLEKVIHQPNWDCNEKADFHERVLVSHCRLSGTPKARDQSESRASETSSMAVSVSNSAALGSVTVSTYPSSTRTPSLGSYSSAKSISSVRTTSVVHQHALDEDEDGALQAPAARLPEGRLACCFSFLNCSARFNDLREWHIHCTAHLRGKLPKEVKCPFECEWSTKQEKGEEAWRMRTMHIVAEHANDDNVDTKSRPAASLVEHFWRHRIINDIGKKELQRNGRITNTDYTTSAGSVRDRRQTRPRQTAAR